MASGILFFGFSNQLINFRWQFYCLLLPGLLCNTLADSSANSGCSILKIACKRNNDQCNNNKTAEALAKKIRKLFLYKLPNGE